MNSHFAYPNILPRKKSFIGCGRYTILASNTPQPIGYTEVLTVPNTPNKNNLNRAVQLLAPESYDSTSRMFHKQDQPEQVYQGDSLDLAWLLAHIMRGRNLKLHTKTDIWCTGVVQLDSSGPHLLDVNGDGFLLKLHAFVAPENNDLLFIVPLANMEPGVRKICADEGVPIVRLHSYEAANPGMITGKTILTVTADELPSLIDLLFSAPEPLAGTGNKHKQYKRYLSLGLLIGIAAACWPLISSMLINQETGTLPAHPLSKQGQSVPTPPVVSAAQTVQEQPVSPPILQYQAATLIAEAEQGNFINLLSFLDSVDKEGKTAQSNSNEQLYEQATHKLLLKGILQYQLADGTKNNGVFGDNNQPALNHEDLYRCRIEVDSPSETLYLYLLQTDSAGSMTTLFPSSDLGTENPVSAGQWPITVPGTEEQWLFLDQLPATEFSSQQTMEIFYLLVSQWRADDIESLIQEAQQGNEDNREIVSRLAARSAPRHQARLPSVQTVRWGVIHTQ